MSVPAKREAAQAASLDQALVMVERERAALTQYERVEEVISAEKRVAALTDLLLRSGATDRLVNEATLLRMEASVLIADHVDEGQEDGQWTWGGDRSKVRSPDLALPITKQRLKECRESAMGT